MDNTLGSGAHAAVVDRTGTRPKAAEKALLPSSAVRPIDRLPAELLVRLFEGETWTSSDLRNARLANSVLRSAVDRAFVQQFQLPTPSVDGSLATGKTTFSAYLAASEQAYVRAVTGAYQQTELCAGMRSLFVLPEPNSFLLRCGNGRLLYANAFARPALFSQVVGAGFLSAQDELVAATKSPFDGEAWRVVTWNSADHDDRIWSCNTDETASSRVLPVSPGRHLSNKAYAISDDGHFCVRRHGSQWTRFFLGAQNAPIVQVGRGDFPPHHAGAICPKTGHALRLSSEGRASITLWPSAETFTGPGQLGGSLPLSVRDRGLSQLVTVCPDGSRFAVRECDLFPVALMLEAYLARFLTYPLHADGLGTQWVHRSGWATIRLSTDHYFADAFRGKRIVPTWSFDEVQGWRYEFAPVVRAPHYTGDRTTYDGLRDRGDLQAILWECGADDGLSAASPLTFISALGACPGAKTPQKATSLSPIQKFAHRFSSWLVFVPSECICLSFWLGVLVSANSVGFAYDVRHEQSLAKFAHAAALLFAPGAGVIVLPTLWNTFVWCVLTHRPPAGRRTTVNLSTLPLPSYGSST